MRIALIFIALVFIVACNNNENEGNVDLVFDKMKSDTLDTYGEDKEPKQNKLSNESIWYIDYTGQKEVLKRGTRLDSIDSSNPVTMVNLINQQYSTEEQPKLEFLNISKDTIYVEVHNEDYLTQRMGSAGANAYMAIATYNLTEVPKVKYVNYQFDQGDHANPGVYTRKDFHDLVKSE